MIILVLTKDNISEVKNLCVHDGNEGNFIYSNDFTSSCDQIFL